MKSASLPGSEMFRASVWRSSDSSGDSDTTCWKLVLMFRWRASISSLSSSRISSDGGHDGRTQVGLDRDHLLQPQARQALDDQPEAAVRQLEHLVDVGGRADRVEVVLAGLLDGRVALGEDGDQLAAADRIVDQADGALAGHGERHERVREEDGVAERQDRELGWNRERPLPARGLVERRGFGFVAHCETLRRSLGCASPARAGTGRRDRPGAGPASPSWCDQLDMSKNSADAEWRWAAIRSRSWAFSRASSHSMQRTAKGSARSRCCEISSPHSKQLPYAPSSSRRAPR